VENTVTAKAAVTAKAQNIPKRAKVPKRAKRAKVLKRARNTAGTVQGRLDLSRDQVIFQAI